METIDLIEQSNEFQGKLDGLNTVFQSFIDTPGASWTIDELQQQLTESSVYALQLGMAADVSINVLARVRFNAAVLPDFASERSKSAELVQQLYQDVFRVAVTPLTSIENARESWSIVYWGTQDILGVYRQVASRIMIAMEDDSALRQEMGPTLSQLAVIGQQMWDKAIQFAREIGSALKEGVDPMGVYQQISDDAEEKANKLIEKAEGKAKGVVSDTKSSMMPLIIGAGAIILLAMRKR